MDGADGERARRGRRRGCGHKEKLCAGKKKSCTVAVSKLGFIGQPMLGSSDMSRLKKEGEEEEA